MRSVRPFTVVTVLALAMAAVGCGKDQPTSAPPATTTRASTASASPSTTPSGSPRPVIEFSVDGAGPYLLGAGLTDLQAAGQLDQVTKGGTCPSNTTARGKGTWSELELSFRPDGKLYLLVNRSAAIPTPSGAYLGTSLAELKKIYAGIPGQELRRGPASAYLVTTLSGRGILFDLDTSQRVSAMTAGEANFLRSTYTAGTPFC